MSGWNLPDGCNPSDLPGYDDEPQCATCDEYLSECTCDTEPNEPDTEPDPYGDSED